MNFLEECKYIYLDTRVTPLILAAHLGRIEFVKILLQNESIEIDLTS